MLASGAVNAGDRQRRWQTSRPHTNWCSIIDAHAVEASAVILATVSNLLWLVLSAGVSYVKQVEKYRAGTQGGGRNSTRNVQSLESATNSSSANQAVETRN